MLRPRVTGVPPVPDHQVMQSLPLLAQSLFMPSWSGPNGALRPFAPEAILIGTIVLVLLAPFFLRRSKLACAAISLVGLFLAFAATLFIGTHDFGEQFHGMLVIDPFGRMWKGILFLFTVGIIVLWLSSVASHFHESDGPEFFTLLLSATLGLSLMGQTSNLLMIFLAIELASLPSYVLAGFRKTHRVGAEASLKYVLFGAASSAIMVYGLSLLYGLFGTLQLSSIASQLTSGVTVNPTLLSIAIGAVIVGIAFKIAAVPFHFWCPDVFEGASVDVTAFLSVASKGAAIILLSRVLMTLAGAAGFHDRPGLSLTALAVVIGAMGAASATLGNVAAFTQTNIKRLLAYSSIAHAGYILCAMSLLVRSSHAEAGSDFLSPTVAAILLYLAIYLFMNLGAFTVAALVWRQTGSEKIADYAGLGRRSPLLAICMAAFMFSLVGLPPLAGFNAKIAILWPLIQNGGWWWALVAVIAINTILSLYVYARVVKTMFLDSSDREAFTPNPVGLALSAFCAFALVAMFIGIGLLQSLALKGARLSTLSSSSLRTRGEAGRGAFSIEEKSPLPTAPRVRREEKESALSSQESRSGR